MSYGNPVILSDVGGINEIVEEGVNGFLMRSHTFKELDEKISYFIKNPRQIKRMGLNAFNTVKEKFDAKKNTIKILDIVKKVSIESEKFK